MKCSKCGDKLSPQEIKEQTENPNRVIICDECAEMENRYEDYYEDYSDADPAL